MISRYGYIPGSVYDGDCRARSTLAAVEAGIHKATGGAEQIVRSLGGPEGVRAALERHGARISAGYASETNLQKRMDVPEGRALLRKLEPGEEMRRPNRMAASTWQRMCHALIRRGWLIAVSGAGMSLVVRRTAKPEPIPLEKSKLYSAR